MLPHQKVLFGIESKERRSDVLPPFANGETTPQKGPVQINLFRRPEDDMLNRVRRMDLSRVTPLDALNFLSEFQESIKTDTD